MRARKSKPAGEWEPCCELARLALALKHLRNADVEWELAQDIAVEEEMERRGLRLVFLEDVAKTARDLGPRALMSRRFVQWIQAVAVTGRVTTREFPGDGAIWSGRAERKGMSAAKQVLGELEAVLAALMSPPEGRRRRRPSGETYRAIETLRAKERARGRRAPSVLAAAMRLFPREKPGSVVSRYHREKPEKLA